MDLTDADVGTLTTLAGWCFALGYEDAMAKRKVPRTTDEVIVYLASRLQREGTEQVIQRPYHKHKYRQVYGAGYDMGVQNRHYEGE